MRPMAGLAVAGAMVTGTGCSVISAEVRAVAEPAAPYRDMLADAEAYVGKTVILGGYVLETDAGAEETVVLVLQAPLDAFDLPEDSDRSEGRILVVHRGYLDPAVYREGRLVTVAGVVEGVIEKTEECPARCLQIETQDLYLWRDDIKEPAWVGVGRYRYVPYGFYRAWGPMVPHYHWHSRYYWHSRYPFRHELRRPPPPPRN